MFDSTTRNRLSQFVSDARRLLCGDYNKPGGEITSLLQTYGIQPDGAVADLDTLPGLDQRGYELGHTLRDVLDHKRANAVSLKAWGKYDPHVYDLIQEQAFTVLNRLCALRMAEERGILPCPVVSAGADSDGFQLYEMVADKRHLTRDERYAAFLFSVFDELSLDLGVLFDRFSPHGMLFPRPDALGELLALINDPALAPLWAEDETIGWIYQYWNSKEERKAMRDASAAPRNSRELAVRNQFFTPRYVVEFLTDNTLGRIWYEMTKGQTRLAEQCRYLVRRPTEIFLGPNEDAPDPPEGDTEETLSQEELLKQPVHIPHRPVKDPREIRLLDPACGSMHFGLYAFDLFEAIYEEAWDKGHCPALQEAYPEKADYLRDVPRLIIEHNIHGVDIDPRAVQIAGLSLWLRAQKTWRDTPASQRPRVRRSNIVCAEPMPGSDAMLEDFVQTLDPPLLGELVKTVFDKMQLAGEAGTLLKIEEEIRTAIDEAKEKWDRSSDELPGLEADPGSSDLRSLSSDFWNSAEERIYAALRDYAESAEAGDYQRRLFAEDAAHGFAFIDLCRKRYDAVVMNPPFGDPGKAFSKDFKATYPNACGNLLCSFAFRAFDLCNDLGAVGAITDRTWVQKTTYEPFREYLLEGEWLLQSMGDLGWGVLDAAQVAACMFTAQNQISSRESAFFIDVRLADDAEKEAEVLAKCADKPNTIERQLFSLFPDKAIAYWCPTSLMPLFREGRRLHPAIAESKRGFSSGDTAMAYRLEWEVNPIAKLPNAVWSYIQNGGSYSPFYRDTYLVCWSENDLAVVRPLKGASLKNLQFVGRKGLTWGKRTDYLAPSILPEGHYFSDEGSALFPGDIAASWMLLGLLNSKPFQYTIGLFCGQHKSNGYVGKLPIPQIEQEAGTRLSQISESIFKKALSRARFSEPNTGFVCAIERENLNNSVKIGLSASLIAEFQRDAELSEDLAEAQHEIDKIVEEIVNLEGGDLAQVRKATQNRPLLTAQVFTGYGATEGDYLADQVHQLIAYLFGSSLGRWDIRYATGERQPPELPDPFDPLPVCPPGMLQNADGLPAAQSDVPDDYPQRITWPGILVDDDGHPEDIVDRVSDALAAIWGDRSAAIEQEACEILGVRTLRDYFAEKKSGGKFFKDHLKRYSKSRRQAPIYWPLSTESGTYTLWIYYHRLTGDTLYACITNFVAPKQDQSEKTLARLAGKGDARTAAEDKEYEQTEALIGELATFRAELERLAKIWKPNLNDGVQITAAPLWSLFRNKAWQKKLKETWEKLDKGDYDWAHLAHTLWPKRVIKKCAEDRSLSIAHGYESDLWEEEEDDRGKLKWQPKKDALAIAAALVAESISN